MVDTPIVSGGGKIGWFCSYVPEELIIAAGLDPVRLQADSDPVRTADSYFSASICLTIKHLLDTGLQNKFSELEGIIFVNSCDGMRRLHDLWKQYLKTPFAYFLELPRKQDSNGIEYFSKRLLHLKFELETHFQTEITREKLEQAISLMNHRRQKMMDIFEQQKSSPAPFKGNDLQSLCMAESTSCKLETDTMLTLFPAKIPRTDGLPRLLVAGNTGCKPLLIELIEQFGASVVAIDSCDGLQHYSGLVKTDFDPLTALAERYLLKPACARMPGFAARIRRLQQLVQDYAVDGVIYSAVKFCDNALFEIPHLEKQFGQGNIPLLVLENDYSWSDTERVKTRIEAFVEMIS